MSVVALARLLCWLPAVALGVLFVRSCVREPRRFRTAVYPAVFVLWAALVLMALYRQTWALVVLASCVVAGPLLLVASCLLAGVAACSRRRFRLAAAWLLAGLAALAAAAALPAALAAAAPLGVVLACGLPGAEVLALSVAYAALLAHAALYRRLPRRVDYDVIVVCGAALRGREPTPVLQRRLDTACELWRRGGERARLVVSGGVSAGASVSEAAAMRAGLLERGVADASILVEPHAASTEENLRFSRELVERAIGAGSAPRIALVSSDFHIFRCMVLARRLDMPLDGVGAPTPAGSRSLLFMRELVSLVVAVHWPYALIAIVWLMLCAVYLWV